MTRIRGDGGEFESNRVSNKEIGEYRETIWGRWMNGPDCFPVAWNGQGGEVNEMEGNLEQGEVGGGKKDLTATCMGTRLVQMGVFWVVEIHGKIRSRFGFC